MNGENKPPDSRTPGQELQQRLSRAGLDPLNPFSGYEIRTSKLTISAKTNTAMDGFGQQAVKMRPQWDPKLLKLRQYLFQTLMRYNHH